MNAHLIMEYYPQRLWALIGDDFFGQELKSLEREWGGGVSGLSGSFNPVSHQLFLIEEFVLRHIGSAEGQRVGFLHIESAEGHRVGFGT